MSDLYPLLMQPLFDPRPWGTLDLSPIYSRRFEEKIGESWLTGDHCKIQNGALAGKSLAEVALQFKRRLVGDAPVDENRFPLLAKFLFPHEKLSVQVHPDDDDARAIGQPWGKTECWYVAHATPEAGIGLGLKNGTTRAQFEKAIHENRAEELLNWVKVEPGALIYVAGGTVHTLGPGAIIVETQQQSDTTFRLYDYGRPRELHLTDGMAAVKEKVNSGKVLRPAPKQKGKNRQEELIRAPYFVVDMFDAKEQFELATHDASGKSSVQILVAVEGCGVIEAQGMEPVTLAKGDAVVVPAAVEDFAVRPQWNVEFLRAYVPGENLSEPETRL